MLRRPRLALWARADARRGSHAGRALKAFDLEPRTCAAVVKSERARVFSAIYARASWAPKASKLALANNYTRAEPGNMSTWRRSRSGRGSDLGPNTRVSLAFLRETLHAHNVSSVLDVPCGDANWQFEAPETDGLAAYAGLDIAQPVVNFNSVRFAHHVNKRFAAWDFRRPMPS